MNEQADFVRSMPFTVERSEEDGDGLTMSGYAAVFNQIARIDSREGKFDEVILPGAFAESLRTQTPMLLFDHGHHPLVGSIPIGKYSDVREDGRGLHVEARLHNNWLTEPIRDAIRERSVTGMSFRFLSGETVDKWTDRKGDVPLREILSTVVPEMGPVVFPAYAGTEVGVRNIVPDFQEVADAEEAVAQDDLTGQSEARSSDGGDATPSPTQRARTRALSMRKI
jgi:HK97 family phage prohead protease